MPSDADPWARLGRPKRARVADSIARACSPRAAEPEPPELQYCAALAPGSPAMARWFSYSLAHMHSRSSAGPSSLCRSPPMPPPRCRWPHGRGRGLVARASDLDSIEPRVGRSAGTRMCAHVGKQPRRSGSLGPLPLWAGRGRCVRRVIGGSDAVARNIPRYIPHLDAQTAGRAGQA